MASRDPESSEIIKSYLAPVAPTVALTIRPDLFLSQHTSDHRITSVLINENNFSVLSLSWRKGQNLMNSGSLPQAGHF